MELTVGYGSLENSFLILIIFVLNKHQKEHRKIWTVSVYVLTSEKTEKPMKLTLPGTY